MTRIVYMLLLPCLFILQSATAQVEITNDKIWNEWEFFPESPRGFNFFPNSNYYTKIENNSIKVYNIEKDEAIETLYSGDKDGITVRDFDILENDELIIYTDVERIYRRSSRAKVSFYRATDKELITIADGKKVMYPSVDPGQARMAYVLDNDIYVEDLSSGASGKITNDGVKNKIINGASDWVYEEEFYITKAYEWSPNGRFIAYLKFDESQVPEYELQYYKNEDYPENYRYKYPKVGEDNSVVTLHIYDTESQRLRNVELENAYYIPRLQWSPDGRLIVTTMNRHQNDLMLRSVNPVKAKIDTILQEMSDTYIDVNDVFRYIDGGDKFVWESDRNGSTQLFLYDKSGTLLKTLSPDGVDVTSFYGYDEKRNEVVFQVADNAINRNIVAVHVETGKKRELENQKGTNSAHFAPTFDYYAHSFQTANMPAVFNLKSDEGKVIRALADNETLKAKTVEYGVSEVEFFKLAATDGDSLNAWMIKPADFNKSVEYPVFMYVYGGPGSQTVTNSWMGNNYWWFQLLASKGVIVVSVDNRGTGARGAEFRKQTYMELGKMETEDQIAAAEQLGQKGYVDASRIGIFGWSYGGFMAANALFQGADVFSLAISVAPVTHWRWYDTIYTERYMRTMEENTSGYDDNSPINHAAKLEGDFLLIHGMVDDNVHFQHTAELARMLIVHGKQFDTYFYPGSDHGIFARGARYHLYTKMTNFVVDKFELDKE